MLSPPHVRSHRSRGPLPSSGGPKPARSGRDRGLLLGLLLIVAAGIAWWAWPSPGPEVRRAANLAAPGDLIAFFGDSITQGYAVRPEESFPTLVGQALGVPIVNAGVPGDTTEAGLARMERDVLPHRPRVTVVEFGGNDFLRRVPVEETLRSLEAIVSTLIGKGMMVVILEVNVGLGEDPYLKGYRVVAERHGALLIPDIMRGILTNPDLKADTIHPNAKGHRLIADRVISVLRLLLQEADRRRSRSAGMAPNFFLPGLAAVG
jgi:acyl-CoA thioesterase-1